MVDGKRLFVFVLIGMFLFSMVGDVVGAVVGEGVETGSDVGVRAAEELKVATAGVTAFFKALFSDTIFGAETLSRIFMALLLAMFIYTAIGSFFGDDTSPWIVWGATISATALALFGLPAGFLLSIRTGYGAMGATILSIIPFLIIFWFSVKTRSLMVAKITWAVYAVYYLILFLSGIFIKKIVDGVEVDALSWPYIVAFAIGVGVFIFISYFRTLFFHGELQSQIEKANMSVEARKAGLRAESERLGITGIKQK